MKRSLFVTANQRTDRRVSVASIVLLFQIAAFQIGSAEERAFVIPSDHSRSILEYKSLGVPEISRTWTGAEHVRAIEVLSQIPRDQLPREGSPRSGRLFEKLIGSIPEWTESASLVNPPIGKAEMGGLPGLSLGSLYGSERADSYLFDRELIRIGTEISRIVLSELADVASEEHRLSNLAANTSSDYARDLARNMIEMRPQLQADLSLVLIASLSNLATMGLEPASTHFARQMAKEALTELVPESMQLMPTYRAQALREELRSLATQSSRSDFQTTIENLTGEIPNVDP